MTEAGGAKAPLPGPGTGGTCTSSAQVSDHGGLVTVTCDLLAGHDGQHKGRIRLGAPGHRELEDAWWNEGDTMAQHT